MLRYHAYLIVALLLTAAAAADEWSQWRGPGRSGVLRQSPALMEAPAEAELKLVWEIALPPRGKAPYYSSPVAAQGRAYLHLSPAATLAPSPPPPKPAPPKKKKELDADLFDIEAVVEDDGLGVGMDAPKIPRRPPPPKAASAAKPRANPNMDDVLLCVDLATGKELWRFAQYGGSSKIGAPNTPVIHKGRAYFIGNVGVLYAVDAVSGKLAWRCDAGEKRPGQYSSSPVVAGGHVIAVERKMVACRLSDGARAWETEVSVGHASPTVWRDGDAERIIAAGKEIVCVDSADGKVLWRVPGGRLAVSPVVGGNLLAIMYAGKGASPTIYRLGLEGAEKVAEFQFQPAGMGHQTCTPSLQGTRLYAWDRAKSFCYDMRKREMLWTGKSPGDGKPSPILADGKLICNNSRMLLILDAATGKTLVSAKIGVAGCTSCGLAGDKLLVNSGSHFRCYDLAAGAGVSP